MKIIILLLFSIPLFLNAQSKMGKGWTHINDANVKIVEISKEITRCEVEGFRFTIVWNEKLHYNENTINHYGGIEEMKVYKAGKYIQTLDEIENNVGLDQMAFWFYDYNMDGYMDFSYSLKCGKSCSPTYYFFNAKKQRFEHLKEWDYIKLWELNLNKKQFLTTPDGTAMEGQQEWYQIEESKLKLLEIIYYGK